VSAIPCDLTNPQELKSLVDQTLAQFGRIDAVINCGAIPMSGAIADEDVPDFDRMYHTNVRSIWLLTKYCIEPMKAAGGGSIVNIASINGHRAFFMCALYAGTKAAVLAMTKELAVELAPYSIRINSVSPGSIPNPKHRLHWLLSNLHDPYAQQIAEEFTPKLDTMGMNLQPLQRTGHGHDVGMACYYLCTPAARFVTGEDILVDGGKLQEMHEGEPRFWQQAPSFHKLLRTRLISFPDEAWKGEQPKWLQRLKQANAAKE
jgi:NAD(P)-dependent dehydrogenase (short-subunit alcohol dehydrogenase family)